MDRLKTTLSRLSFRSRLLLLLIGVSIFQVAAAAWTYHDLQTAPVNERLREKLSAAIQFEEAPMVDAAMQDAGVLLQDLAANSELRTAIEAGDPVSADMALQAALAEAGIETDQEGELAADGLEPAPSEQQDGQQSAQEPLITAYVTDRNGDVIAGEKPDAPMLDSTATLQQGADLVGEIHVPVVFDSTFFERANRYTRDITLWAANDEQLYSAKGAIEAPRLEDGLQVVKFDDTPMLVLAREIDGTGIKVGSAIPEAEVTAIKNRNRGGLLVFVGLLIALMVGLSIVISRSVSLALRRFAGSTERLASGNLHERLPVIGGDEIAALSQSFNVMASSLETTIHDLQNSRARLHRQVQEFGKALENAHNVGEILTSVCTIAIESTSAEVARFWTIDTEADQPTFELAACVGLRPRDTEPSHLEMLAWERNQSIVTGTTPDWVVAPARSGDQIVGLLTMANTAGTFESDDRNMAERLATQAAFALDNIRMHERLRLQAERDGLTGLANHRIMQERLSRELEDAYDHRMPLGIAMLDVDNFKKINDTHGHHIGDEALKAIAKVLTHRVAGAGIAARYGGEEFVIVMAGCDSAASWRIAEHVREEITRVEIPLGNGAVLRMTASFGVSNTDMWDTPVPKEELLKHADSALYVAKRTGKNKVQLADPSNLVDEKDREDTRDLPTTGGDAEAPAAITSLVPEDEAAA